MFIKPSPADVGIGYQYAVPMGLNVFEINY